MGQVILFLKFLFFYLKQSIKQLLFFKVGPSNVGHLFDHLLWSIFPSILHIHFYTLLKISAITGHNLSKKFTFKLWLTVSAKRHDHFSSKTKNVNKNKGSTWRDGTPIHNSILNLSIWPLRPLSHHGRQLLHPPSCLLIFWFLTDKLVSKFHIKIIIHLW